MIISWPSYIITSYIIKYYVEDSFVLHCITWVFHDVVQEILSVLHRLF